MDSTSYAAPAHVRALVVPVGPVTVGQFHRHYERLRQASVVSLIDVHLPSGNESASTFDPHANPTGCITYSFETSPSSEDQETLFDLEPWRQQFLAVGIAQTSEISVDLGDSLVQLRKLYPKSIYHVIFLFGTDHLDAELDGVFPISQVNITAVESALSTITSEFLVRMSKFWLSRQYSSFQSPSLLTKQKTAPNKRNSHQPSPSGVTLGRNGSISMTATERAKSRQEGRTRKFLGNLHLLTGRISDALTEFGMAAAILKEHEDHLWLGSTLGEIGLCLVIQKYMRAQSGVPSAAVAAAWAVAARHLKKHKKSAAAFITHHYGNGPSATSESSSPAISHRNSSVSSAPPEDGAMPNPAAPHPAAHQAAHQAAHPAAHPTPSNGSSPRTSLALSRVTSLRKSKPFTDQTPVEEILEYLTAAALDEYIAAQGQETVPYTVYYEHIVRFANLLICLRFGHGWSEFAMEAALDFRPLAASSSDPGEYPTIVDLENWISKIYTFSLNQLEPDVQALILGTVARLYSRAGMRRKWAFTCSQVVNLLASSRATVHTDLGQVAEVLQVYISWPKLEAEMLRKLIPLGQRIQNASLQTDAAAQLLALACRKELVMVDKEQMTLYHIIRGLSDVSQAPFWDPTLVLSAKVKSHRLTSVRSKPQTSTSALLYNPYEEVETKEVGSVEAGVPTSAKILLSNPLAIEIELFELALVDENGDRVSETVESITLPANASQYKVEATVVPPMDRSTLEITGCYVHVSGCSSETFPLSKITVPIIPARPVLVLQELSLHKGWTMLLEGERKQFTITLWNSSNIANKILHFGFHDSTVDSLRSVISRQDISRAEFHEYEYFLHKRLAIDLVDEVGELGQFNRHESHTFKFNIIGKRGVSSASVLVDYGISEETLRRLRIPLQITIYPSIAVERASILPSLKKDTVLLVLDLRNFWRNALTCKVWADGTEPQEQRVDISSTKRFVVEVPWEPTLPEDLLKPIPSLSRKQYTVDTKTPPDHLQLFWLREKLLSRLHGEWWSEQGRSGYIELRMIQITKRMAAVLKTSPVHIVGELTRVPQSVDDPACMTVTVTNNSPRGIQGVLRLVPNKPAQRYMLVLGSVQELVTLGPGERTHIVFEMVFLNTGPFEVTSVLDSLNGDEPVLQVNKTLVNI